MTISVYLQGQRRKWMADNDYLQPVVTETFHLSAHDHSGVSFTQTADTQQVFRHDEIHGNS